MNLRLDGSSSRWTFGSPAVGGRGHCGDPRRLPACPFYRRSDPSRNEQAKEQSQGLNSPHIASQYVRTRFRSRKTRLPNERRENRVLLIYGIYTQGSQAAIEYLTNPERMTELRKALIDLSADRKTVPRYFQALLTTTVENAVPGNSSLVAVRAISN